MDSMLTTLIKTREIMFNYGQDMVQALIILVAGLIVTKWLIRLLKAALFKLKVDKTLASTICNVVYVLILVLVITFALVKIGADTRNVIRLLIVITLGAVALIIVFRPYFPTLPFKVGNTIFTGNILGRVEATTFLNTRLKTFDGKTVFVPNSKILNDYLVNYHFTPTRKVHLNLSIGYDQDLLKAKQVLESIMIADPRVKIKPRPVVFVLNLGHNWVELGGRCWVDNAKYWAARCDLIEKTKLRFDHEGIRFAFPQRGIHLYHENEPMVFPESEMDKGGVNEN